MMTAFFERRPGPTTPPPEGVAPSDASEVTTPLSPSLEAPAPGTPPPAARRPTRTPRVRKRLRDSDEDSESEPQDSSSDNPSSEEDWEEESESEEDLRDPALEDTCPSPSPPRAAASPSQWQEITRDAASLLQRTAQELQSTPRLEENVVLLKQIASALHVLVS